jgi:hypothetical protein
MPAYPHILRQGPRDDLQDLCSLAAFITGVGWVIDITINTTSFVYLLITYIYLLHDMFRLIVGHHHV